MIASVLSTILSLQMFIGLSTTDWYWTYGMIGLLGLFLTTVPASRRLGVDQWLAPHLQAKAGSSRVAQVLSWFA